MVVILICLNTFSVSLSMIRHRLHEVCSRMFCSQDAVYFVELVRSVSWFNKSSVSISLKIPPVKLLAYIKIFSIFKSMMELFLWLSVAFLNILYILEYIRVSFAKF